MSIYNPGTLKPSLTTEHRRKISLSLMGHPVSDATRRKISDTVKNHPKQRIFASMGGKAHLGKHKHMSEAWYQKQREAAQKRAANDRAKQRTRETVTKLWQDPTYVSKQMKARNRMLPNKCETKLLGLLNELFPKRWQFVGGGQLIIGGRCPDFVAISEQKVIELLGTYWHGLFDGADRVEHYKMFGYRTLIIWEDELKGEPAEDKLVKRLRKFTVK